jgi:hypothetical protein
MEGGTDAHGAAWIEGEAHPLAIEEAGEFPVDLAADHVVLRRRQPLASRVDVKGAHALPQLTTPPAGLPQPLRIPQPIGAGGGIGAVEGAQGLGVEEGVQGAGVF